MKKTLTFLLSICFLAAFSQIKPKYKYIVFHSIKFENLSSHIFDANGIPTNRYKIVNERGYFTSSKKAWESFNSDVVKRNGKIIRGGVIVKVWIDSVVIK